MRSFIYILKMVGVMLVMSICSGMLVMAGYWLTHSMKITYIQALFTFEIGAITMLIALIVSSSVKARITQCRMKKVIKIVNSDDDKDEALAMVRKQIINAKSQNLRQYYIQNYATICIEANKYDECLSALKKIDTLMLSDKNLGEYYNSYMYCYLMMNDIDNASRVYEGARIYFDQYLQRSNCSPLLHTLGVYRYALGEYEQAIALFLQAKNQNSGKQNQCDCDLYLSLCCLKTNRIEDAKKLAVNAVKNAITSNQRQQSEKLKKLVEISFSAKSEQSQLSD